MTGGWFGVDLDGTLAEYAGWKGADHIGAPIPLMVARVKRWLAEGKTVKIFTARVAATGEQVAESGLLDTTSFAAESERVIRDWCERHIGQRLEVTCKKDYGLIRLYDDRVVQVEMNTGRLIGAEED